MSDSTPKEQMFVIKTVLGDETLSGYRFVIDQGHLTLYSKDGDTRASFKPGHWLSVLPADGSIEQEKNRLVRVEPDDLTTALGDFLRTTGQLKEGDTFKWASGGPIPTATGGITNDNTQDVLYVEIEHGHSFAEQGRAMLADADAAIAKGNAKPEDAYKEASKGT